MASGSSSVVESYSDNDEHSDGYQTDEEQSSSSAPPASKKPRLSHSKTRFNLAWTKRHPCIVQVTGEPGKAYCTMCSKSFSVCHQGYRDVKRHMEGSVHQSRSRVVTQTQKISDNFVSEKDDISTKVISQQKLYLLHFCLSTTCQLLQRIMQGNFFVPCFPTVR